MDYTEIILGIIGLIVAVLSAFLIPYIKSKYTKEQIDRWENIINIGVAAAEQLYNSNQGKEKKEYVLKYLQENGVNLDMATIENMIEASVLLLHNELYGTKQEETK